MATSMRGLTQYISDIRACRVRELEEKRINKEMAHIRQKFKDGNLDGYQKKKYLSKVVFTYILGYKVDVGHMEAINLISSTKYSEKQIGYLALTLLLHENSDLIRLVINSIRKDLDGSNEVNECLALHAIANIGGKEMAEAISEDVHRLMISATSSSFVKKKAALTLLRLYRKHPTVIPVGEWAERIVSVMDDDDPGVALTVTTLVTAIAQDHLDAYSGCYSKAVDRLSNLVFDRNYPVDYVYYKVPNPWMQIKLLRLLQYYPPPDNQTVLASIYDSLQAIIDNSQEAPRNVQHNNAQNAVLFEAINLAIHLDPESSVVQAAAVLLGRFILAKETNVRYLGLDAMAHLAACSTSLDPVKKHQDTIILSLKDRDISVRRRALDLLYSMCDATNAKVIVGELLRYLGIADYNLREEMVLKMAILTERFATEYEWYVDTILQLISSAGDHVGSEVWWRVVQLVTNNEDVQHYAATVVFKHLQVSQCHENLIKVSGAILGEFGHLIANEPGCSPIEQFHALHSKINLCTAATRALLLTTYLKWVNLFPEIKDQLVNIFDRYRHVLDAELQQRACEYYAIAMREDNDELIQIVCEEMPIYPERESALLSRLHSKGASSQDKRTWVIGGKDENKEREAERFKNFRKGSATLNGAEVTAAATASAPSLPAPSQPQPQRSLPTRERTGTLDTMMGASSSGATEDIMSSLAGLDLTGTTPQEQPLLPTPAVQSPSAIEPQSSGLDSALFAQVNPAASAPLTLGPNIEKWLERLSYSSEGVLYEDGQLQIGIKAEYHGSLGRLALFFGNKTSVGLTSFNATIDNAQPNSVSARFHEPPVGEIGPLAQVQEMIHVECKDIFTTPPILRLSFKAVTQQFVVLKLPIFLCKFVEGVQLDQSAFFERWKIIGGPPREAQAIFPIKLTASGDVDLAKNSKVLGGQRLSLLENIDPNLSNLVVAGVLHMSTAGKVGILGRLEPNKDAKLCRLTIRSTNDEVSAETLRLASTPLSADTAAS